MVRKENPSLDVDKIFAIDPISSVEPFPSAKTLARMRKERWAESQAESADAGDVDGQEVDMSVRMDAKGQ